MKLLFASSEYAPLIKTGGLADVAAALPAALLSLGLDVRVILPAYRGLADRLEQRRRLGELDVRGQRFTLLEGRLPDSRLKLWLLDCPVLFDRPGDPYHDEHREPWGDNAWRFGCYCEAVARIAGGEAAGWRADVVHANDWQSGLVPAWLSRLPKPPRSVFTIHNLAFQGQYGGDQFLYLGLPGEWWHPERLEYYGGFSFLKGGVVFCDALTTVSPTYALEIQTPSFGHGMDGLLRACAGKLSGILNGIDTEVWNPSSDPLIARRYSLASVTQGKRANKQALQAELALETDESLVLIGMISRFAHQKGTDLPLAALAELLKQPVQFAVLGSGDRSEERGWRTAAARHPGRVAVRVAYDEGLAHRIEAGADLFLMPSRYEPCGLNQMYSQRYGTLPLVHRVGGLADTVVDASPATLADGSASGVCFNNADTGGVLYGVRRGVELLAEPRKRLAMRRAAMARDFSWTRAAQDYLALYQGL